MSVKPILSISTVSAFLVTGLLAGCATTEEPPRPMTADVSESFTTAEGVPGGVATRAARVEATVRAIDYDARTVTLVDDSGGEVTVSVGPEAVNFDQVERGDRVNIVYTEETVVYLKELDEAPSDGVGGVAAHAPEGEKPQGFAAGIIEMTAVVTGVDLENHTATLLFSDGSSRVVPVRDDVELNQAQVGQEVVIQTTAAIDLSVEESD